MDGCVAGLWRDSCSGQQGTTHNPWGWVRKWFPGCRKLAHNTENVHRTGSAWNEVLGFPIQVLWCLRPETSDVRSQRGAGELHTSAFLLCCSLSHVYRARHHPLCQARACTHTRTHTWQSLLSEWGGDRHLGEGRGDGGIPPSILPSVFWSQRGVW